MTAQVTKATRPEFGAATIAMVEQWTFEPALKDGRPTRSLFSYQQGFAPYDAYSSQKSSMSCCRWIERTAS